MQKILAVGLILAAAGAASADTYTNEADFLAQLDRYCVEEFDGYVYGDVYPETTLTFICDEGFAYDLYAALGLWAGDGNMSTNDATDTLSIIMSGDPVYAVGGYFFGGDIDGFYFAAEVTVTLSDGQVHVFTPDDPYGGNPSFLGFTSTIPIETVVIDVDDADGALYAWSTVDHLYIGDTVPQDKPGDVDGDGHVGQSDLGLLLAAYDTCEGDPFYNPDADFNGDNCVGQSDLGILLANYEG